MKKTVLLVAGLVVASFARAQDGDEFFESRIRPVLADNCFFCHTGDSALAGLRMDSRDNLIQGGDSGPALTPGKPDESLLVVAVRHERDDLQMPMGGDKLSARQIEDLVKWVEMGAPWPSETPVVAASDDDGPTAEEKAFWSFQPLSPPEVPAGSSWSRTDIDRFVEKARMEQGLEPVGFAGRRELLRRVSYDLVGLPPTPEEVDAFLADDSEEAFAKVVDRLLDSPHYGERWGRHWLDVVRYGEDDTRGLAKDGTGRERYGSAHVFRDWVISAMNRDMPYDLFVRAHFAGEQLDEEEEGTIGGVGFLGGGPWYYDIAEPSIARADERHDRVDVTTRGFLGLTVGCARCHDHKFDPISISDYYALAGVFYNTDYEEYPVAPDDEVARYKKAKEHIEALEKALEEYLKTESEQLARVLALDTDRYMVAAWKVAGEPEMTLEEAANEDELDLETLTRVTRFLAKEPRHYPYLVPWQEMIAEGGTEEKAKELASDFERLLIELQAKRKKIEEKNEWIIANGSPPPDERKSVPMPNEFESFFDEHQLELESMEREELNLLTDVFRRDLDKTTDVYKPEPGLLRFSGWGLERRLSRVAADHVAALRAEIEKLEEELPEPYPFVMGVKDRPQSDITEIRLHLRGNPHNLGEKEPRHFPAVLSPDAPEPFRKGSGRLELGEAIASHPLAARVIVNRIWRWHFGTGLVETPSNFGRLGERPKNPELLEYLASWFVDNGMSFKKLHREILLSSVYRLAADHHEANAQKDPGNRYYWRANRTRLDAEAIRDSILFVSGGLDLTVGGPSLDLGDVKNVRRTVYGEVSRFRAHDYLQTFDFPNPSITAEQRFVTNVPLQSLFFMNSDLVTREAGRLVYRLAGEEPPEAEEVEEDESESVGEVDYGWLGKAPAEDMIRDAYRRLYSRDATDEELSKGLSFIDSGDPETRFETWVAYLRVLFGTNEFRFVS